MDGGIEGRRRRRRRAPRQAFHFTRAAYIYIFRPTCESHARADSREFPRGMAVARKKNRLAIRLPIYRHTCTYARARRHCFLLGSRFRSVRVQLPVLFFFLFVSILLRVIVTPDGSHVSRLNHWAKFHYRERKKIECMVCLGVFRQSSRFCSAKSSWILYCLIIIIIKLLSVFISNDLMMWMCALGW